MNKPQIFRSTFAFVLGWVWVVFAIANGINLVVAGRDHASVIAGAILLLITAVVYVTSLRPQVTLGEDAVRVRNPFRNATIPLRAIDDVEASYVVTIRAGETVVRSWTPQSSSRQRAKAMRMKEKPSGMNEDAAAELRGKTHVDWVAEQILEAAKDAPSATEQEPRHTWSLTSIAIVLIAVFAVVAAIVTAP